MNERIRQLADEATELDYETFDEYNHKTVQHYKFNKDKFAELIVRECAGVGYDASYYECALNVSNKIKQHFGVEE